MTLQDQEVAEFFAQLMGDAVREPLDTRTLLATLAHGGSTLFGASGAKVEYAPDPRAPVQCGGTDLELRALSDAVVRWGEGPGHDVRTTGCALIDVDVTADPTLVRWPRWTPRARALGHGRVTALPLRARETVTGALVLFCTPVSTLDEEALALARSFAEAAGHTLALQHELAESRVLAGQLEHALSSRVVVEQAKGILAAQNGLSLDAAFAGLRGYARSHQRKLPDVAREVIEGRLKLPIRR
ncbi:GAF and ANTAR domain-containing protein [Streptomyces sp. NPDC102360]|uniref:GAF and ANTAR domain-containing protein n=1 Tax=Streptomyces sp. NPDC102360 TaxID=3366160 RepID=UPI0037F5759A